MKISPAIVLLTSAFLLSACDKHSDSSEHHERDHSQVSGQLNSPQSPSKSEAFESEKELKKIVWALDSLESIQGNSLQVEGDVKVVNSPFGKALSFDGDGDRILVNANPFVLIGLSKDISQQDAVAGDEFTIEVLLKPNAAPEDAREPRFFHIEDANNPMRRITLELRLNDKNQWWLDAYIKSEKSQLVLIDETLLHPTDEWAHVAVTYRNETFTTFINGLQELSGAVDFLPIAETAKTSIGARINQVHWFNGDIAQIAFVNRALPATDFSLLAKLSVVN